MISVKHVSKKFCKRLRRSLWYGVQDIGKEVLGWNGAAENRLKKGEFWAVRDVSFEVNRGECLGLIGHNGAGKSTLLKMLNGLLKPDAGEIALSGRVGALIELGAGFNQILTGRENIYITGSIRGFTKKEIDKRLDAIIAFSEIEDFLDMPVQNYSSGMKVRLGFAVAAQMEPDTLLIDEVLAVGDLSFRAKCFNAIGEVMRDAAVIFVSHSISQVARVATQVMVLHGGHSIFNGTDVADGIEKFYGQFASEKSAVMGSGSIEVEEVLVYSNGTSDDEPVPTVSYLSDLNVEIRYRANEHVDGGYVTISFFDKELRIVAESMSSGPFVTDIGAGDSTIRARLPRIAFAMGTYTITLTFWKRGESGGIPEMLARYHAIKDFRIVGKKTIVGHAPIILEAEWEFAESKALA